MRRARRRGGVLAGLAGLLLAGAAGAAQIDLAVLAHDGQPAPGVPGGKFHFGPYAAAHHPAIGRNGHVVFQARLDLGWGGVTEADSVGYWVRDPEGRTTLVARRGDPLPQSPEPFAYDDVAWTRPGLVSVDAQGRIAFVWQISDPVVPPRNGLFGPTGASGLGVIALEDRSLSDDYPGLPTEPVDNLWWWAPKIDDRGRVAFAAAVDHVVGIWRADGERGVESVIRTGDEAPGLGAPLLEVGAPRINRAGDIAFCGTTVPTHVTEACWITDGAGGWRLVARVGEPAVGIPGAVHRQVGLGAPNAKRESLLGAVWEGELECDPVCSALYRVDPQGAKALVLRSGDPAPGAGPDELLGSLGNAVLNDRGQIATIGTILLPPEEWWYDEQAVFGPDGPNLALRAREGDPAPGLAGRTYHEFERVDLNIHGEMVFWAKVEPTALGTPRKGGLFFVDRAGAVQPILGPGQTVTVAEGDVRLVDFVPSLDPIGKSEARTIFTDSGAIVFPVEFTDGTGALILAQVQRVHACGAGPELALLLLVARRARKLG